LADVTAPDTTDVPDYASRMSGHITGQVVVVDGGVNAKFPYPAVNMVRK
jgi:hypothetical protein